MTEQSIANHLEDGNNETVKSINIKSKCAHGRKEVNAKIVEELVFVSMVE